MTKNRLTIAFLFFVLFLSVLSLNGEEGWRWRSPLPQGNTLRAASIFEKIGIAVGDFGTIIRTVDNGRSWSFVPNPFAQHLRGVSHVGRGRWLAAGEAGLVIASEDDGRNWERLTTGIAADLFAVEFATPVVGAAVGSGGTILWSADGGRSWTPRTSGVGDDLRGIAFLSAEKAIVVGKGGTILKTSDSGETWVRKKAAMDLYAVRFTDEANGFAAGGNLGIFRNSQLILRTTDGGESWQPLQKKGGPVLYGLSVSVRNEVVACGQSGVLVRGSGGGSRWTRLKSPTKRTLSAIVFSGSMGMAIGSYGAIVTSADGGKTWKGEEPDKRQRLGSMSFADAHHGLAMGREGMLYWTSDGGETWTASRTAPGGSIMNGRLLNPRTAIALSAIGGVLRTADGGATWERIPMGSVVWLNRMNFANECRGVAVGYSAIVTTEDGGKTWIRRALPRGVGDCHLMDVAANGCGRWLAVGMLGVVLASGDNGATWTQQHSGTTQWLRSVAWSDPRTATIVGENGLILQCEDGGGWSTRKSGTSRSLTAVGYVTPSRGFVVGEFGTILATDDGGKTWKLENSHTGNHLFGLCFAGRRAVATGWDAAVLTRPVEQTPEWSR